MQFLRHAQKVFFNAVSSNQCNRRTAWAIHMAHPTILHNCLSVHSFRFQIFRLALLENFSSSGNQFCLVHQSQTISTGWCWFPARMLGHLSVQSRPMSRRKQVVACLYHPYSQWSPGRCISLCSTAEHQSSSFADWHSSTAVGGGESRSWGLILRVDEGFSESLNQLKHHFNV